LTQEKVHQAAKPRLHGLDSLRGLAAIAVVLYHYTVGYNMFVQQHRPGLLLEFINGHFAVDLFFVISGFVIFMTLERSSSLADFAVSRFARLWPPYIACAAFTSSVIVLLHFNPMKLTLLDALLNSLMMNKALGIVAIDPSYWTLTCEVLFYAGVAISFFVLRIRRMEWACLAWLAVSFLAQWSHFDDRHVRIAVVLGTEFCQFFVLGMMIYLITQRRNTWLTTFTALLAYLLNLFGPDFNPGNLKFWQFMLMSAAFPLAVWFIAERKPRFLNVWPLLFLGEISYSLYLIHQIAGYWVIRKLEDAGSGPNVAVLVAIMAATAAAACVRRLVELPAQKAIRGWYRGLPSIATFREGRLQAGSQASS
jgi:peptidoglycan/LPS O-acetylase OafA/YrhL